MFTINTVSNRDYTPLLKNVDVCTDDKIDKDY